MTQTYVYIRQTMVLAEETRGSQMTFYKPTFKIGKSKRAKEYHGEIMARTTTILNRYNAGMTVGHGFYKTFSHTDPIGSSCRVLGWFDDGRVSVALPHGGCGILGRADVAIESWPAYVPEARRAAWLTLPLVSRVSNGEILTEA